MDTSSESSSFNVSQNEEPKKRLKRLRRRRRRKASGPRQQTTNPTAVSAAAAPTIATSSSNSTDTNAGDQPKQQQVVLATNQAGALVAAGSKQLTDLAIKQTVTQHQQSTTEPPTICNTRQQAELTAIAQSAQVASSPSTPGSSTTRSASEPSQDDNDDESNCGQNHSAEWPPLDDSNGPVAISTPLQQQQQAPPSTNRNASDSHYRRSSSSGRPVTIPVHMIAASGEAMDRPRPSVNAVRVLFRSSSGHQLSSATSALVNNNYSLNATSNNGHNLLRQHHQQSIVNANRRLIERQIEAVREIDSLRWNFDFRNCRPLGLAGHRYVHCNPVETTTTTTTRDDATVSQPLQTNSAENITNNANNRTCRPIHDQNNQQSATSVAATTTTNSNASSDIRFTLHNPASQWATMAPRSGHQTGKDSPHQNHSSPEDK